MELIEDACDLRHSLEGIREESELPEDYYSQVAQFTAEVADALEAAHASHVIHRDLKPGNIMVTPDEHPKVADFGLAKLVDENSLSVAGDVAGTYFYMSPEQVATKRAGLDHRTDIFSLGVVLYEMLTLVRPFEGDTTEHGGAENACGRKRREARFDGEPSAPRYPKRPGSSGNLRQGHGKRSRAALSDYGGARRGLAPSTAGQ